MTVENFFFNENNGNGRKYLKFQRNKQIDINIIVTNLQDLKKRLMWKMKVIILVSCKIKQNLNEYKQINVNTRISNGC